MSDRESIDNVLTLIPRLQVRRDYFSRMNMKGNMYGVLAEAFDAMRQLGATNKDIADILRFAAEELNRYG